MGCAMLLSVGDTVDKALITDKNWASYVYGGNLIPMRSVGEECRTNSCNESLSSASEYAGGGWPGRFGQEALNSAFMTTPISSAKHCGVNRLRLYLDFAVTPHDHAPVNFSIAPRFPRAFPRWKQ